MAVTGLIPSHATSLSVSSSSEWRRLSDKLISHKEIKERHPRPVNKRRVSADLLEEISMESLRRGRSMKKIFLSALLFPCVLFLSEGFVFAGSPEETASRVANLIKHIQQSGFQNTPESIAVTAQLKEPGAVYLALREAGRKRGEAWAEEGSWGENVELALYEARQKAKSKFDLRSENNTIELDLTYDYQNVPLDNWAGRLSNLTVGVYGLEVIQRDGSITRIGPTSMIAANRNFNKHISLIGLPNIKRIRRFKAHQILVPLGRPEETVLMYRGNRMVTMEDVHQEEVRKYAESLADWLVGQVHKDGRVTYKYWPSVGMEADSNNMIRQWMASVSLIKWAKYRNFADVFDKAERNIRYNLENFYRTDRDLGLIEYQGQVKLGAAALAALAILEHPERVKFRNEEQALQRFMDHMQQEDGSFYTFYPTTSRANQNYYPGETLFYWAHLYEVEKSEELLEKFMRSFRYYRTWHRENLNPAFVPWHTEADYMMWQHTKDPELKDFIFEMNDWLLEMQQWESAAAYPDTQGRFYNPKKPGYGPPHASATGVYLEGLVDAFRLAREVQDKPREDAYRLAIRRGLRSAMQLQFRDEVDMFYISKREAVRGGMRTTVYDNSIRVDNVQHNLMAAIKVLEHFEPEDYR